MQWLVKLFMEQSPAGAMVILALVAFIFYQLGKRAGLNSAKNQTPAPREPAPVDTQGRGRKVAKS